MLRSGTITRANATRSRCRGSPPPASIIWPGDHVSFITGAGFSDGLTHATASPGEPADVASAPGRLPPGVAPPGSDCPHPRHHRRAGARAAHARRRGRRRGPSRVEICGGADPGHPWRPARRGPPPGAAAADGRVDLARGPAFLGPRRHHRAAARSPGACPRRRPFRRRARPPAVWATAGSASGSSRQRFAEAVARTAEAAAAAGRPRPVAHELNVWCGIDRDAGAARARLAAAMDGLYATPFERFERYSPAGSPEQVAEFLAGYVDAGCQSFNLIVADDEPARWSTRPSRCAPPSGA